MSQTSGSFLLLQSKTRFEIVAFAKKSISASLGAINFDDFPQVRVFKTSKSIRVEFAANMSFEEQDPKRKGIEKTDRISFLSFSAADRIEPTDKKFLFKYTDETRAVRKMFDPADSLSLEDGKTHFDVWVYHPASGDETGGAEQYRIDKKTLKKTILAHEHPEEFGGSSIDSVQNRDDDPEVEIK